MSPRRPNTAAFSQPLSSLPLVLSGSLFWNGSSVVPRHQYLRQGKPVRANERRPATVLTRAAFSKLLSIFDNYANVLGKQGLLSEENKVQTKAILEAMLKELFSQSREFIQDFITQSKGIT